MAIKFYVLTDGYKFAIRQFQATVCNEIVCYANKLQ